MDGVCTRVAGLAGVPALPCPLSVLLVCAWYPLCDRYTLLDPTERAPPSCRNGGHDTPPPNPFSVEDKTTKPNIQQTRYTRVKGSPTVDVMVQQPLLGDYRHSPSACDTDVEISHSSSSPLPVLPSATSTNEDSSDCHSSSWRYTGDGDSNDGTARDWRVPNPVFVNPYGLHASEVDDKLVRHPFAQHRLQPLAEDSLQEDVIRARQEGLQQIQSDIQGIHQLYQELNWHVGQQQNYIDSIESTMRHASDRTAQALEQVRVARLHQRRRNTRTCVCLLGVALIIILACLSVNYFLSRH
mmetsp:Transcript_30391/g.88320  ORF Transcript_30391/g.88320 Transcript_30391/m.88320 type:complete len:298 (+) Transcript_30391:601-1494(+)